MTPSRTDPEPKRASEPEAELTYDDAKRLQSARDYESAAAAYERLAAKGVTLNIAANLGVCLTELGRFDAAARWLAFVVEHRPNDAGVRWLVGNLYGEIGDTGRAETEYRLGLALDPTHDGIRLALSSLLLSVGRYADGWPLLEARAALHPDVVPPIKVSFPEWKGEPIAGRSILVWYEQGFGDQLQFVRFARDLKARGAAHVAMGCRPVLADLFRGAAGVDEVVPADRGESVAIRRYDYWSRYFSVPHRLGVTVETLDSRPYLTAPADRRDRWAGWSGVGLVWQASPTGFNARSKNVPDALARRLLGMGARSLHPEDTGAKDFADTASIIEQLDLVISIDTSVAHLAGAMGKPCWTLLPRVHCDWRWMRDRADSPWYPSMRLYRQTTPFDWTSVIDQVAQDLAARQG